MEETQARTVVVDQRGDRSTTGAVMMQVPLLLKMSEAATVLGYTRQTVCLLTKKNGSRRLGYISHGRRNKRIPRAELLAWIERNTIRTREQALAAVDRRRKELAEPS